MIMFVLHVLCSIWTISGLRLHYYSNDLMEVFNELKHHHNKATTQWKCLNNKIKVKTSVTKK